ncbi:MAG: acetoacetate--CoA ligase [Holosporales bacterium]|jgi:acetoacetyl-CoA synthetase|nr:acetoacetate--CoA ligase [Holosporales bacterium]
MTSSTILWKPSFERIVQTNLYRFMRTIEGEQRCSLPEMHRMWEWSVKNPHAFWNSIWDFCGVIAETKGERITNGEGTFERHHYFPDARLNFAENLLRRRDERLALVFWGEDKVQKTYTYKELFDAVERVAHALKELGVKPGDRVAGYVANMPETLIAAIATISIGAIWSSCSPDFGPAGALDRFGQVAPKVLFAVDGYFYKGKTFDNTPKIVEVVAGLPSIEKLVVIPYIGAGIPYAIGQRATDFYDFIRSGPVPPLKFKKFPFNHPIYIMFTSGTTGVPKCIVHGAGGTLLQHLKEHQLHCDIKPNDRVFYFTTCSWMMWNWFASVLSSEATLLLYDGSPLHPKTDILFDYADAWNMTLFGTSAKYLDMIAKMNVHPIKTHKLATLKTIGVTGSPLSGETAASVYKNIKKDVHLNVFSGGTDIISCFMNGNPISPVYADEMQGRGLGMRVEFYSDKGKSVARGEQGELVCTQPFPSQPLGFWGDATGERYHKAYFETFPNIWCHGDWGQVTANKGVIISGRADTVLNPGGVRIGTAEIYEQVCTIKEVLESLAVGQQWHNDERVILFVVLAEGVKLTDQLIDKIKSTIRTNATPRHVPSLIIQVPAVPHTKNGKITEIAVKCVIHGREVKNKESLEDASVLEYFRNLPELAC